jgi:membrane protein DedA with SNARE-associated domain
VTHLIVTYGYFAVALLVAVESLGVPLPGETILVAAALYAGQTHHLSIWILFVVAAASAIVGDNVGYVLGRVAGDRLIRRYGHFVRLDEAKLAVGRDLFDRHGAKVVFFGRFVSILRTYAAFLSGTARMPWRQFFVYNAAGGVLWAALYAFASYGFGNAFSSAQTLITWSLVGVAVATVMAIAILLRRRNRTISLTKQASSPVRQR